MPFNFDWADVTALTPRGERTANPVIQVTLQGGGTAWLKAAPGGARIVFAGKVMERVGFENQGVFLVARQEASAALDDLGRRFPAANGVLGEMRDRVGQGEDLIVLQHVGGNGTYQSYVDQVRGEASGIGLLDLMAISTGNGSDDFARMMAADLLLGNFDRISIRPDMQDGSLVQMNTGNFIYDAARHGFLPIDNDTLAPSFKHLGQVLRRQSDGKSVYAEPTREDLYRVAILGGELFGEATGRYDQWGRLMEAQIFPSPHQPQMHQLLGDSLADRIELILTEHAGNTLDPKLVPYIKSLAQSLAPKVRETMRRLVMELKSPDGGREGLFKTMKACGNVEGMNYSVFKVKSRFAELMTKTGNPDTEESVRHALAYGAYRDWKEALLDLAARPAPDYPMPLVMVSQHDNTTKVKRFANTLFTKVGLVDEDRAEDDARALAKTMKTDLRKGRYDRTQYNALKATYLDLRGRGSYDNRVVKATLLSIGVLVKYELTELLEVFASINARKRDDVVAALYAKALAKTGLQIGQHLLAYHTIIENLEHMAIGKKKLERDDLDVMGLGIAGELPVLLRRCQFEFGALQG